MQTVLTATQPIAIQGISGSYHEIAARRFFGPEIELEMCDSFPELFQSMEQDRAGFGVVAIENTVAGTLLPNYALLRNSDFRVIGEVFLRIEHCLMALHGQSIEEITEVHSHPMAILQCQEFFKQYPAIRLVERVDTAASAEWIQQEQKQGVAAIASERAADYFGLEILSRGIETHKRNFTRFLIIAPPQTDAFALGTPDKASLCFSLAHEVGSLAQILLVLSSHGMNLTKIQSSPIVGQEWQYFFHIDLEYKSYDQYRRSLQAIQHLVGELKILGEYPRGEKPGV